MLHYLLDVKDVEFEADFLLMEMSENSHEFDVEVTEVVVFVVMGVVEGVVGSDVDADEGEDSYFVIEVLIFVLLVDTSLHLDLVVWQL